LDILQSEGIQPELFCCIYATVAFLSPEDFKKSRSLLTEPPECDYAMGVSEYNFHPVQALIENNGYWKPMWPEYRDMKFKLIHTFSAATVHYIGQKPRFSGRLGPSTVIDLKAMRLAATAWLISTL